MATSTPRPPPRPRTPGRVDGRVQADDGASARESRGGIARTLAIARALPLACAILAFASPVSADDDTQPDTPTGWRVGRTPQVFEGDGPALRVGGWTDASYQDNDIDSESFNLNHLNFYFDARSGERWQAFLEMEFENEAGVRGFEEEREYEVEQVYARFKPRDDMYIRAGQFNTPFGIWTPLHWSILMDTITEPIHEGTRVTPEQQVGVEAGGRTPLGGPLAETELRYSVFLGYGDDSELFERSNTDGLSFGTDLRFEFEETSFLGLSLYQQQRTRTGFRDRTEKSIMAYGELHPLEVLTLRFEIFRQRRDRDADPALSKAINIGYVKARWDFTRSVYLNYRYGYGDDEGEGASDERHTHTITLGYRPTPEIRVKLEYAGTEFRDTARRDFHYGGISVGVLF